MDKWGFTSAKFCEVFLKKGGFAELQFWSCKFPYQFMLWRWRNFKPRSSRSLCIKRSRNKDEPSDVQRAPKASPGRFWASPHAPKPETSQKAAPNFSEETENFSEVWDQTSQKLATNFSEVQKYYLRQSLGSATELLRTPRKLLRSLGANFSEVTRSRVRIPILASGSDYGSGGPSV